jgi:hypothetical protein
MVIMVALTLGIVETIRRLVKKLKVLPGRQIVSLFGVCPMALILKVSKLIYIVEDLLNGLFLQSAG